MKKTNFSEKTTGELVAAAEEAQRSLLTLRTEKEQRKLKNLHTIREKRKELARILTALKNKETSK